jgi:hypothetical protein
VEEHRSGCRAAMDERGAFPGNDPSHSAGSAEPPSGPEREPA